MLGRKPYYTVRLLYSDTPREPENSVYHAGAYGLEQALQIAALHMARPDARGVRIFAHTYNSNGKVKTKEVHKPLIDILD